MRFEYLLGEVVIHWDEWCSWSFAGSEGWRSKEDKELMYSHILGLVCDMRTF